MKKKYLKFLKSNKLNEQVSIRQNNCIIVDKFKIHIPQLLHKQMDHKMSQETTLSELQLELMQMGFQLNDIRQAMKHTKDKQRLIQTLLSQRQVKAQFKDQEIMSLNPPEEDSKMKDQNEEDDQGFQSVEEEYKMIFLARMDLKLSLGKMAASVATACLGAFKQIQAKSAKDEMAQIAYYEWLEGGQKKIVVKINNEAELLDLAEVIKKEKVNIYLHKSIKEDELQVPQGTITVAAVGPAPQELLDKLTRHLKLY